MPAIIKNNTEQKLQFNHVLDLSLTVSNTIGVLCYGRTSGHQGQPELDQPSGPAPWSQEPIGDEEEAASGLKEVSWAGSCFYPKGCSTLKRVYGPCTKLGLFPRKYLILCTFCAASVRRQNVAPNPGVDER